MYSDNDDYGIYEAYGDCTQVYVVVDYTPTSGKGLINTTAGATPFYTNATSNPNTTIPLSAGESQLVTFWVNATGDVDSTYEFFAYANLTKDLSISNRSGSWNVTIVEAPDNTPPIITIIQPFNTTYDNNSIAFNITANEPLSKVKVQIGNTNHTMTNASGQWQYFNGTLADGSYQATFWFNDTAGNWNKTTRWFTIEIPQSISISFSSTLANGVNWNVASLPSYNLSAQGNNGTGITQYDVAILATGTTVDLYAKADGDLSTDGGSVIGLGNETFSYNATNSTVPAGRKFQLTTSYAGNKIGSGLANGTRIYLKFFLNAPASQAPGNYSNLISINAVPYGETP